MKYVDQLLMTQYKVEINKIDIIVGTTDKAKSGGRGGPGD
jgi:hypothetical protein